MISALCRETVSAAALTIADFDAARGLWDGLLARTPAAGLYHGSRWLDLLRDAYAFDLSVASLRSRSQVIAACVMAQSKIPFVRRLVALPFSDRCEPLALEHEAGPVLLTMLAADPRINACEIRGAVAPAPWRTVDYFQSWELSVSAPAWRLYQGLATNFRRNIARARRLGLRIERGTDRLLLRRFYLLHCGSRRRQGLPVQPESFFRTVRAIFAPTGDFEVWLASQSGDDLAAVITLRDRDRVYYKWSARAPDSASGAGHLIVWDIVEALAGTVRVLDLGRSDLRNHGLNRFKRELGATASPLPYSFVPRAPQRMSPEVLSGWQTLAAGVWRHLPPRLCRTLGGSIYRYLS